MDPNDFTLGMQAPVPWGPPPSQWQGGSYADPSTNFAQLGGRYLGNIGALGGMGMDATMRRGMWDVRSAGGYGNAARAQQHVSMIQGMMSHGQDYQRDIADQNMTRMGGAGYDSLSRQGKDYAQGVTGLIPGAHRIMTPGQLSFQGMQQAFGAVANYGNQWSPDKKQLVGFHDAFQNYFYAGGKENFARTGGLGADDMMAVVAESARRGVMKPAIFSETRKAQDAIYGGLALGGDLTRAGIKSGDVLADLDASMGDIVGLRQRLTTRLRKSGAKNADGKAMDESDIDAAVKKFTAQAQGSDIETLRLAGGMKGASAYGDVFRGYKNAGFGGDFGQLMDKLEQQFGDAALNPERMKAMQQKLSAIVDMTGKSLEEISNLMAVVQDGPGAGLSGERAATMVGVGTGTGAGLQGLTKAQRMQMQGLAVNAMASTAKSPRAVVEDILQGSGDPAMQALGKQLQATGQDGKDMLRGIMTDPSQYGLTGGAAAAFKAMAAGDMRPASTMRAMQEDLISRQMTAYNQGTGDSPARKAERARLEGMNVTFNAAGKATGGGVNDVDRARRAGADILGSIGGEAQDVLRKAGAEFGTDLTPEQQLAMGSAVASLTKLGSQAPALPALQAAYEQISGGKKLTAEQALAMGQQAVGRVGTLGTSINAGYYQNAVDRSSAMINYNKEAAEAAEQKARRTGALNSLGDIMMSKDLFSSMFGGEKPTEALLNSKGITDKTMVAGILKLGEMDEKTRESLVADAQDVNRMTAQLEGSDEATRKKLEANIAERQGRLKASGVDSLVEAMADPEKGAAFSNMIRDAADREGKRKELTVKVVGVLRDAKGKEVGDVQNENAEQNNATAPEDKSRVTK